MLKKILNYWYKIEYFTPCYPIDLKKDINLNKKEIILPWLRNQHNKNQMLSYDLYFGKIKSFDLIKWMISELNLPEDDPIEPDNKLTCIFAIKVDEKGYYVPSSFSVSSFVWAVSQIVLFGDINTELNPQEVSTFEKWADDLLIDEENENKRPFNMLTLQNIFTQIIDKLGLSSELSDFSLWARKKSVQKKKDGTFPDIETSTELFQSFFLNDIKRVIASPTKKISEYALSGIESEIMFRYYHNIASDVGEMMGWLTSDMYPLGVWPGKYDPSLMQQIGINIATHGKSEIFSINGPPGTGKTTLLKEIIASNIVERAKVLIKYDNPDDAFQKVRFADPIDRFNTYYHHMDEEIKKFGIVVASNNNAAVENISVELPKAIAEDRTGRFSNTANEDIYFGDVASKLIGENAWGLISAKLGKKTNLTALKERLLWAEDGITLKQHYDEDVVDWNAARKNFKKALENVLEERKLIAYAKSLFKEKNQVIERISNLKREISDFKTQLNVEQSKLNVEKNKLSVLTEQLNQINNEIELSRRRTNPIRRKVFVPSEIKLLVLKKYDVSHEVDLQKKVVSDLEENLSNIAKKEKEYDSEIAKLNAKYNEINKRICIEKIRFKNNWADDNYWENIIENEKSQESCPWVYPKYNELREELFYQALQVHKAFILSGNCVKQNLYRLMNLWDEKYSASDRENAYGDLLNTLLLVIPVVSTTFASAENFLSDIKQDELGLLIIDEAGQATPQSALGVLWRAKKAIVVGDPLQIEPVSNVPKELMKRFADEYDLPPSYRTPDISVQIFADRANPYGGYRTVNNETEWLGCPLLVHRRCINPMFEISNEVAYDNKMFLKSQKPKNDASFLFDRSVWVDIKGSENGNKDHTVRNQVEFTERKFRKSIEIYQGFPNLYIITPFKRVAENIKKMMRSVLNEPQYSQYIEDDKVDEWIKDHCGTVHTFQGKEAHEVILVLGCDKQSGKGAAKWVGAKPNIINVAVSRAKYRIAVIGDFDLWNTIPNVNVLCKHLPIAIADEVTEEDLEDLWAPPKYRGY